MFIVPSTLLTKPTKGEKKRKKEWIIRGKEGRIEKRKKKEKKKEKKIKKKIEKKKERQKWGNIGSHNQKKKKNTLLQKIYKTIQKGLAS